MPETIQELSEEVEKFQNTLVAVATGRLYDKEEFVQMRDSLVASQVLNPILPRFVRTCRNADQFWDFIKNEFSTYRERRAFLWDSFRPVLEFLEAPVGSPNYSTISGDLGKLDSSQVQLAWNKAMERLVDDPEGAITSARTLLESVCKHILDESTKPYEDNSDLPKLYGLTARELSLAPDQHSEQIFKQILGGCQSVVNGLAGVRNRFGNAHGQGSNQVRPSQRHAKLAVNLAGSMAAFLVETWESRRQ